MRFLTNDLKRNKQTNSHRIFGKGGKNRQEKVHKELDSDQEMKDSWSFNQQTSKF